MPSPNRTPSRWCGRARTDTPDGPPPARSPTGRRAAAGPGVRPGRERLVVTGGQQRRYDLAGVVEPDAFARDGDGLFVLEWLPPEAPDRSRVRLLALATNQVEPLLTRL